MASPIVVLYTVDPDGTHETLIANNAEFVFGRTADDDQRDLYTVNADGGGLFQVTHTPDISEFNGDWGTHPVTH